MRQDRLALNIRLYFAISILSSMHFDRGVFMLYLLSRGLNDKEIGILQVSLFLVSTLAEVPTGLFADRFGRKGAVLAALLGLVVYAIGMIYADDFWLFFLLFIILAFSFALNSGAASALFYDTLKALDRTEDYLRMNSRLMLLSQIAFAIALVLGGYLSNEWGWNVVYLSYALVLILAAILTAFLIEPPMEVCGESPTFKPSFSGLWSFLRLDHNRPLFFLTLAFALFEAVETPLYIYGQALLNDQGYSKTTIGAIYGIIELITALGLMIVPWLGRKFSFRDLAIIINILSAALISTLVFNNPHWVLFAFVVTMSIPFVQTPLLDQHLQARIPSSIRASLLSLFSMVCAVATALSYLAYAILPEIFGLATVMASSALISLLGIVFLLKYFQHETKPMPD